MGHRQGLLDPRGQLSLSVDQHLRKHKPKAFVLENSPNMARLHGGDDFLQISGRLRSAGYTLQTFFLTSTMFGLPQKRERVFVVGMRADLGVVGLPDLVALPERTASDVLGLPLAARVLRAVRASGGSSNPFDHRNFRAAELDSGHWIQLNTEDLLVMQGLPVGYYFNGDLSVRQRQRLIGNAVCPPIAFAILEAVS